MSRELVVEERRRELSRYLRNNPFLTDDHLAEHFSVSVQTIRLDRIALGIPEMRERVKKMAQKAYGKVRAVTENEMVGELVDLDLGRGGISILEITPDMTVPNSNLARGHYLFAQANSLALAVVDAPAALTGSARVRYKRLVSLREKVVAKAAVKVQKESSHLVSVYSRVGTELVFKGQFIVWAQDQSPAGEEG